MPLKRLETVEAFDRATNEGVCLVDFNAPWCGPCKAQAPILEELADAFAHRAAVAEVDVSANREIAQRFGIQSIPTLVVFKEGREQARFVGLQPRDVLAGAIEAAV
ncbi:MAG: thioredoxin [Desulfobacterales bacterium]|nr:thioredoxin [Desulfobacterales bacterium]MBS3755764.1 thioredoxin [Desulfobacterales bacterium]